MGFRRLLSRRASERRANTSSHLSMRGPGRPLAHPLGRQGPWVRPSPGREPPSQQGASCPQGGSIARPIPPAPSSPAGPAHDSPQRLRALDATSAIMSTLTYSRDTLTATAVETEVGARKPVWRRIADAMIAAQRRRAEREIALISPATGACSRMMRSARSCGACRAKPVARSDGLSRQEGCCGRGALSAASLIGFKPDRSGTGSSCCGLSGREYT